MIWIHGWYNRDGSVDKAIRFEDVGRGDGANDGEKPTTVIVVDAAEEIDAGDYLVIADERFKVKAIRIKKADGLR